MPARPSITDFQPGTPYGVPYVALFLGRTPQRVRELIAEKRLAAFRPAGSRSWMIPGEAVIEYVGRNRLHAAIAAKAAEEVKAVPTPAEAKARVDRILRRPLPTRRES